MSSFYSDASLVMIPSGYKTSKVYSAKPTDGAGDLVFTRSNDTATRVGPDGLIEKVRTNLLLQSNTFSTTWLPLSGGAVTGGQSGYDGTNNAWLLSKSAAGGFIYQTANSFNGQYTLSIYAKANASTHIRVNGNAITDGDAFFNLSTGAIQSSTNCVAEIVSVGGGWYRCSITSTDADLDFVNIYPAEASGISATSGSVFIQDAQLEKGDIATDYIATTTAAVSVGPVANVPRLDFLGSSCPRLLLEPQRQNLALFSESFDNAAWNKVQSSATANQMTSPSGYQDADLLIENTVNSSHSTNNNAGITSTAGIHTASAFFKKNTKNFGFIQIATDGAANRYTAVIDLVNGTITNTATLGSPTSTSNSIVDYGNGWYRVSVSAQHTSSTLFIVCGLSNSATPTYSATAYPTYIGNGTDSIGLWGAQLELGSYASSYVNTLGAAVTRGAESASKTGIASLIGQSEGTLFADFEFNGNYDIGGNIPINIYTGNSEAYIFISGAGSLFLDIVVAGVLSARISGAIGAVGRKKIAFAYKANDFVGYMNGIQIGTDTSGSVGAMGSLSVGAYKNTGYSTTGGVNQALLFKARLENDDLAALTAL